MNVVIVMLAAGDPMPPQGLGAHPQLPGHLLGPRPDRPEDISRGETFAPLDQAENAATVCTVSEVMTGVRYA
jgi:hypothetical protein